MEPKILGLIPNSLYIGPPFREGYKQVISAAQIRAGRVMIGAKQIDLAKAAGISLATLNNIERGIGDPRTSTLEAIRLALEGAGVELRGDADTETVTLQRVIRPHAFDTFVASAKVLEVLGRRALMQVEKVLFFARKAVDEGEGRHRICLLVEGANRSILFDRVNFSTGNAARAAEVAGIFLAAFAFQRSHLFYLGEILADTVEVPAAEVLGRLRAGRWRPLRHPKEFVDVFDDWDGRLAVYARRRGHPMADLAQLIGPSRPGGAG
ncbi:MAG: helix-turn-helix domain-containing protein [Alphaproteobacteria bacterium]